MTVEELEDAEGGPAVAQHQPVENTEVKLAALRQDEGYRNLLIQVRLVARNAETPPSRTNQP